MVNKFPKFSQALAQDPATRARDSSLFADLSSHIVRGRRASPPAISVDHA